MQKNHFWAVAIRSILLLFSLSFVISGAFFDNQNIYGKYIKVQHPSFFLYKLDNNFESKLPSKDRIMYSIKSIPSLPSPLSHFPSSFPSAFRFMGKQKGKNRGVIQFVDLQQVNDLVSTVQEIQNNLHQYSIDFSSIDAPPLLEFVSSTDVDTNTVSQVSQVSQDSLLPASPSSSSLSPFPVQNIEGGSVTAEQLIVGFVAGVFPFVWAAYEFWKRIDTQQRCGVCKGSGLVSKSEGGKILKVARKCYACGGFIPWLGWKYFWFSNLNIGNGGILRRPADNYEELSAQAKKEDHVVQRQDRK